MLATTRQTMALFYAIGAAVVLTGLNAPAAMRGPVRASGEHHIAPSAALPAAMRRQPTAQAARGARPDRQHNPLIFTAQYWGNDIEIYKIVASTLGQFGSINTNLANPQGIYSTPATPSGPRTNGSGNLYVANSSASNVLVFTTTRHGLTGPVGILQDASQYPDDVAVSQAHNMIAVSNQIAMPIGTGSVSVYAGGATSPTGMLTVPGYVEGIGVAFDREGDCYWSLNTLQPEGGMVVEFAHCAGQAKTIVSGLGFAGGVAFDRNDNLYYVDQLAGIFKCTKNSSCGLFSTGFGDPVYLNFDTGWNSLWVSDASGYIDEVDPTTGALRSSTAAAGGGADPPVGIAAGAASRY